MTLVISAFTGGRSNSGSGHCIFPQFAVTPDTINQVNIETDLFDDHLINSQSMEDLVASTSALSSFRSTFNQLVYFYNKEIFLDSDESLRHRIGTPKNKGNTLTDWISSENKTALTQTLIWPIMNLRSAISVQPQQKTWILRRTSLRGDWRQNPI